MNRQFVTVTFAQFWMEKNPPYGAPWSSSPVTKCFTPSRRTFERSTLKLRAW